MNAATILKHYKTKLLALESKQLWLQAKIKNMQKSQDMINWHTLERIKKLEGLQCQTK